MTLKFAIYPESSTVGFHAHIRINLNSPIESQLNLRTLVARRGAEKGDIRMMRKILEQNASLRVAFGWSFESSHIYEDMMRECIDEIAPRCSVNVPSMVSDLRCDWLGFMPYNTFERAAYDELDIYNLILFNNNLIAYQTDVVKFITQHKSFQQHTLIRDNDYRFELFKRIRKSPGELEFKFQQYIEAIYETNKVAISRDMVEEAIGMHYLYHPEVFFEMLEFYKLKGLIYE